MNLSEYFYCGFRRIVAAAPTLHIADTARNTDEIIKIVRQYSDSADIILFPELSLTGYTCADLFGQERLLRDASMAIHLLCEQLLDVTPMIVVGAPMRFRNALYNCAVVICDGEVKGIVPKTHIPNYSEYYEARWFASGANLPADTTISLNGRNVPFSPRLLFSFRGMTVGAEICEDLWVPTPPSGALAMAGANVILNLSASNETIGKYRYRRQLIAQQSARCRCAYAYASAGAGESSTDLAFPGYTAVAEDGRILAESPRHEYGAHLTVADIDLQQLTHDRCHTNTFMSPASDTQSYLTIECGGSVAPFGERFEAACSLVGRTIDPHPFVPADPEHRNENCTEIINIQCLGLRRRLEAIGCRNLVIGVSGGLDSTLALLVACRTFDMMGLPRTGIQAITMPGLATTSKTRNNAWQLMQLLGVSSLEIPIGAAVDQHFSDIGQDPQCHDAAFENSQARERTQILMDYANKCGGIVLGTGDLSELALGWCTYNGDHMSMYAVNASVPKTLVRHLVEWFADREVNKEISRILIDIVNTPISPELVPSDDDADTIAQKTEDLVGPYELHDFFLYHTLRYGSTPYKVMILAREAFRGIYDDATLVKWLRNFYRRFFNQQFKRSCMPDGPKVGSVCLSPRGDWRMPSDASAAAWLREVEHIEEALMSENLHSLIDFDEACFMISSFY
ncbi:MAG: NAD(+) synthase [Muribaculaceae bacterium]|nr:NAD(+) synthase [Muribaculaceae bacterium]